MIMSDFSVAKANAETKKRIADLLMQQSQNAISPNQWTKLKPAQALVKGLESFGAAYLAASGAKDAAELEDKRRNALVQMLKGGGQLTPDSMIEYGANPEDIMSMQLKRQFTPKQIESTSQGLAMIDPLSGDLSYIKDPTTGKVVSRATADPLLQALITRGREGEKGGKMTNQYGQEFYAPQKTLNPAFGDFTQNAQPNAQQPQQPQYSIQPSKYDSLIDSSAQKYGLDPNLLRAMMKQESAGNPRAVSSAGAVGLMQLMPATAQRFGVTDRNDPAQSVDGGAQYMRFLLDKFNGDKTLAIAAYNAGEGAVDKYGGIPPYKETRDYVRKVLGNYQPSQPLQVAQADNVQTDGIVYGQSPAEKAAQTAAATLPYDVAKQQAQADITVQQKANLLPIEQQQKINDVQAEAQKKMLEEQAIAKQNLPKVITEANNLTNLLNELKNHKGLAGVVGAPSIAGALRVPGTEEANFRTRLDQVKGKAFLQAFESLKGSGAITEKEGEKATDAIVRLNTAQTEDEFKQAINDFNTVITNAKSVAKQKAGIIEEQTKSTNTQQGVKFLGFE